MQANENENERIIDPAVKKLLLSISPIELATLSTIIGIILAAELTTDEQNVIGNVLQAIGQVMLVIAAHNSYISSEVEKVQDGMKKVQDEAKQKSQDEIIKKLQQQIDALEKRLDSQLKL